MILRYKDHLIYILAVSFLSLTGMYFIEPYSFAGSNSILLKISPHLILLVNSCIIYLIAEVFTKKKNLPFAMASLYLVNPLHFDVFFHPLLIQALVAETILLTSIYLYSKELPRKSFYVLILATVLNTKLIFFLLVSIYLNKFSKKEKMLAVLAFLFLLINLYPLFFENYLILLKNYKTPFYIAELFIIPLNLNFLNLSVIYLSYYSTISLSIIFISITMICYYFNSKEKYVASIFYAFTLVAGIGSVVPYKEIFPIEGMSYLLTPTLYPTISFSLLILLFLILENLSKLFFFILTFTLFFVWLGLNVNFQSTSTRPIASWERALANLHGDFSFEKRIKRQYVSMLIENAQYDKAKEVIKTVKLKFPDSYWYSLLLSIANQKHDDSEIKKISEDLIKNRVPYDNPEQEN